MRNILGLQSGFNRLFTVFCVGLILFAGACKRSTGFEGVEVDPPIPAPPIVLESSDNGTFRLEDHKGSVVLLFFGYTSCPDICPTTLIDWARLKKELGKEAEQVKFVFVSVDPERDSASIPQRYVENFDRGFIGLTGSAASIAQITSDYGASSFRDNPPPDVEDVAAYFEKGIYTVSHSSQTFVIDRDGNIRVFFPYGMPVDSMLADVRSLL